MRPKGVVRYRFLRYVSGGRIAYAIERTNGVTELRFARRR